MKGKVVKIIAVIVCGLFIISLINLGIAIGTVFHSRYAGFYQNGIITIKTAQLNNNEEYMYVAEHEWAHHLYDKYFTFQDRRDWKKAVDKCGYHSVYAQSFKTVSTRMNEEWADCFAYNKVYGFAYCPEKQEFIERFT